MNTNFHFLSTEWPEFFDLCIKAEKFTITDPRTSLTIARSALELAVNWMFSNDDELDLPFDTSLNSLIKQRSFQDQFQNKFYTEIDLIRKVGNLAIHNKKFLIMIPDQSLFIFFIFPNGLLNLIQNRIWEIWDFRLGFCASRRS